MDIVLDTCPMPACNLTPRDVRGLLGRHATYHAHFAPVFARCDQARWAEYNWSQKLDHMLCLNLVGSAGSMWRE